MYRCVHNIGIPIGSAFDYYFLNGDNNYRSQVGSIFLFMIHNAHQCTAQLLSKHILSLPRYSLEGSWLLLNYHFLAFIHTVFPLNTVVFGG